MILCDLQQGKITHQWWLPGALYPLALDATGTRLLVRAHGTKSGKNDTLELIATAADGRLTQHKWTPYPDDSEKTRDILWAGFAGTNRLVTMSEGGKLTVWNGSTLQPLC